MPRLAVPPALHAAPQPIPPAPAPDAARSRAVAFDALWAASDLMAMAAISALRQRGARAPEDVRVVGDDDIALAERLHTPLATTLVVRDSNGAGRAA